MIRAKTHVPTEKEVIHAVLIYDLLMGYTYCIAAFRKNRRITTSGTSVTAPTAARNTQLPSSKCWYCPRQIIINSESLSNIAQFGDHNETPCYRGISLQCMEIYHINEYDVFSWVSHRDPKEHSLFCNLLGFYISSRLCCPVFPSDLIEFPNCFL